jgi:hypothetical protein
MLSLRFRRLIISGELSRELGSTRATPGYKRAEDTASSILYVRFTGILESSSLVISYTIYTRLMRAAIN